jgi:hypothetical protein
VVQLYLANCGMQLQSITGYVATFEICESWTKFCLTSLKMSVGKIVLHINLKKSDKRVNHNGTIKA